MIKDSGNNLPHYNLFNITTLSKSLLAAGDICFVTCSFSGLGLHNVSKLSPQSAIMYSNNLTNLEYSIYIPFSSLSNGA